MALVSDGWKLTVGLMDNGGNVVNKVYNLVAANAADAATARTEILAALNAVTMAVIKSASLSETFVENAIVFPGVAVQNENRAQWTMGIDGEPLKKYTSDIPAPVQNLFIDISGPGADIVDLTEASLLTYVGLFEVGGVASVSDGEFVEQPILAGKRIHRKNSNG